jgi:divalent metal cation (Fe/Co/Zn/Cd) transporter
MSLDEAHKISEKVDIKLREILNAYVTVHVDPVMRRTALYRKVEQILVTFCKNSSECSSFHDLRILGENNNLRLALDLVINPEIKIDENQLVKNCRAYLMSHIAEISDIIIKVEPLFSVTRKSRHN